ncbi:MAG: hypothetical protein V1737_00870 [Chloroflexota bacterium]
MEETLKCLRCGLEYPAAPNPQQKLQERTCPRCKSNSVRRLPAKKE